MWTLCHFPFYMSGKDDAKTKQYTYVHLLNTHAFFFFVLFQLWTIYTFTMASVENSSFMYSYRWELFAGHNSGLFGTWKCGISAVYESHGPLLSFKSAFASTTCWMLLLSWGAGWAGLGGSSGCEKIFMVLHGLSCRVHVILWVGVFRKKGRELLKATHSKHSSSVYPKRLQTCILLLGSLFICIRDTYHWKFFFSHHSWFLL